MPSTKAHATSVSRIERSTEGDVAGGRPTILLLLGLTGAGKSTLGRRLAREKRELYFSIDEWLKKLFWMDAPSQDPLPWVLERCRRVDTLIASLLEQEIAGGRGAVLDLGFSKPAERKRWIDFAEARGAAVALLMLDVPREERWARVEKRNLSLGPTDVAVDRATFDWMEGYFEPPTDEELRYLVMAGGGDSYVLASDERDSQTE